MNEIFKRTSIRKYEDRPVEKEKIEKILRAAMAAPSAGNQQPWEFYVVTNKKMIEELSNASQYAGCAKGAPVVLVPCYMSEGIKRPEYAQIDLSIACENILLEITALGLGGVWLGIAPVKEREEKVEKIIGLNKQGLHAFALIALGYPAEEKVQQDRYDDSRIHYLD